MNNIRFGGIPQKLSLEGNTLILSDGGGNVTLPVSTGAGGQVNQYEMHGTGTPYGTWYLGGAGDSNMLRFQFTDPVPTDRDIGDIRVSSISYLTSEPWPGVLP